MDRFHYILLCFVFKHLNSEICMCKHLLLFTNVIKQIQVVLYDIRKILNIQFFIFFTITNTEKLQTEMCEMFLYII